MEKAELDLIQLFKTVYNDLPLDVTILPGSGSYRTYYRMTGKAGTVLGVHNEDLLENKAFISFTNHFRQEGIPVPEIIASEEKNRVYLVSDLGDLTLYQYLTDQRAGTPSGQIPADVLGFYKKVLAWLPVLQVNAGRSLDYSACYPRAAFDRQSMMWDLNYFKYYYLKLAKVPFEEQALEDDFHRLCDFLLTAESDFFLFRDFQSRNIMVFNNEPWFIDYQGGRKGALQYDVASLLTDGKADLPENVRQELLGFYLDRLGEVCTADREKFMETYYGFVLIRILQALGAYGFRGYYEKKSHFLQSIPYALRNLRYLRDQRLIGFGMDALMEVIDRMVEIQPPAVVQPDHNVTAEPGAIVKQLTISICSFSYKKSIPPDTSGNGGGFVFDCRALPNPGRYDEYKLLIGKDQPVIDFLSREHAVDQFLENVFALVDQSVKTYTGRGFEHLMVSFGCTGGRHRSVYCAEKLARHLQNNNNVIIRLLHAEHPW